MNTLLFLGNLGTGEILIILVGLIIPAYIIYSIFRIADLKNKVKYLEKLLKDTGKMR
jgi:hypothetical protein